MNWLKVIDDFMEKLAKMLGWEDALQAPVAPDLPPTSPVIPKTMDTPVYDFSTPQKAFHSVRVICDEEGLSLAEKNLICACIMQESGFVQTAKCENKDKTGTVWSVDVSICQVNDWFHIGPGKDFPSIEYVMANQDKVVRWMIKMYRQGMLKQWVSYSSLAYKKYLSPTSAMWKLKT